MAKPPARMTKGERFRRARKARGIDMKTAAELLDVTIGRVGQAEGGFGEPTDAWWAVACGRLGINPYEVGLEIGIIATQIAASLENEPLTPTTKPKTPEATTK